MNDDRRVLCVVCIVFRGVTLADAMAPEELGRHMHAEHTAEEVERALNLRQNIRAEGGDS